MFSALTGQGGVKIEIRLTPQSGVRAVPMEHFPSWKLHRNPFWRVKHPNAPKPASIAPALGQYGDMQPSEQLYAYESNQDIAGIVTLHLAPGKKVEHLGIKVTGIEEEEYCYIPMGGPLPARDQRIVGLGGACVVHGMLVGSLFGAIVGQRFPGAIYVSQTLEFRKPVFVGETVRATIQVQGVRASGRMLDFDTRCTNQKGELVLTGGARCLLPRGSPLVASREEGAQG